MSTSIFSSVDGLDENQIEALDALLKEFEKVDVDLKAEQEALQRKYNKKRQPVYKKQRELVKSVPTFWKQVFESHPVLLHVLDADDADILGKLVGFFVEESDDGSSASITFNFEKGNPHFTNTTLKKEVVTKDGECQFSHTPVDWVKGRKRKADPTDDGLFFSWFQSDDPDEMGIFDIIKSDLWPRSLQYFAGLVDDEAFDESESDAGSESEDIESSEEEKPSAKKTKKL